MTDAEQPAMQDPKQQGPQPAPEPEQRGPGTETRMRLKPDHGEDSYRGSGKLEGRRALVTGGDSGIGRAVALAFAREGADVLISYLDEEEDARETARLVEEAGRKAVLMAGDIAEEAHCRALVERTVSELGGLDVLVNNAAYQRTRQSLEEITTEELEYTFRVNILAMFHLCKAAVAHLPPGASIVNVCSIQAYQPSPSLLAYASTKGAIVTFTKGLAKMLAERGVRVNVVAPGPVWTPLIPATLPAEQVEQFGQDTPIGRPAQPAELAPVFVLLASQQGSYMTGGVYPVTGGEPTA
jgi:hypothetical protein